MGTSGIGVFVIGDMGDWSSEAIGPVVLDSVNILKGLPCPPPKPALVAVVPCGFDKDKLAIEVIGYEYGL